MDEKLINLMNLDRFYYNLKNYGASVLQIQGKSISEIINSLTIERSDSDDYAAVYTFKRNGEAVGDPINIPKDLFAFKGRPVTFTINDGKGYIDGQEYIKVEDKWTLNGLQIEGLSTEGTYIEISINNGNPFYINISELINPSEVEEITDESGPIQEGDSLTTMVSKLSNTVASDTEFGRIKTGYSGDYTPVKVDQDGNAYVQISQESGLEVATSENLGGIKIGYEGDNYAVKLTQDGKAYVQIQTASTEEIDNIFNYDTN